MKYIPETKGKSLEDLEKNLGGKNTARSHNNSLVQSLHNSKYSRAILSPKIFP